MFLSYLMKGKPWFTFAQFAVPVLVLMGVIAFAGWVFGFDGLTAARWVGVVLFPLDLLIVLLGIWMAYSYLSRYILLSPRVTLDYAFFFGAFIPNARYKEVTTEEIEQMIDVIENKVAWQRRGSPVMEKYGGDKWQDRIVRIAKTDRA